MLVTDSETETTTVNPVLWQDELRAFTEINLNKPALLHGYNIDTSGTTDQYLVLYTAKDSSFEIKQIEISVLENHINRFKALHSRSNFYYSSHELLTYVPDSGYSITIDNTIRTGSPINMTIKGNFVFP